MWNTVLFLLDVWTASPSASASQGHQSTRPPSFVRCSSPRAPLPGSRAPPLLLPVARRAPWHPVAINTRRRSTGSIRQQARFQAVEGQGRELDSAARLAASSIPGVETARGAGGRRREYFIGGASSGKPVRLEPWRNSPAQGRGDCMQDKPTNQTRTYPSQTQQRRQPNKQVLTC